MNAFLLGALVGFLLAAIPSVIGFHYLGRLVKDHLRRTYVRAKAAGVVLEPQLEAETREILGLEKE